METEKRKNEIRKLVRADYEETEMTGRKRDRMN